MTPWDKVPVRAFLMPGKDDTLGQGACESLPRAQFGPLDSYILLIFAGRKFQLFVKM